MPQFDYPRIDGNYNHSIAIELELNHLVPLEFTDLALGFVLECPSSPKYGFNSTAGEYTLVSPGDGIQRVRIRVETPLNNTELIEYYTPVIIEENPELNYGKHSVVMGKTIYRNPRNYRPGVAMLVECDYYYEHGIIVNLSLTHNLGYSTLSLITVEDGNVISNYGIISPFVNEFDGNLVGGYIEYVVNGQDTTSEVYKPFKELTDEEASNARSMIQYSRDSIRALSSSIKDKHIQDRKYNQDSN